MGPHTQAHTVADTSVSFRYVPAYFIACLHVGNFCRSNEIETTKSFIIDSSDDIFRDAFWPLFLFGRWLLIALPTLVGDLGPCIPTYIRRSRRRSRCVC